MSEDKKKSSVLSGGLKRTSGSVQPKQAYDSTEKPRGIINLPKETLERKRKPPKDLPDGRKKEHTNQKQQIKISEGVKEELAALKFVTKTKFDYELVELLIDYYVNNELSVVEQKKYKNLIE